MNASEARELTKKSITDVILDPLKEHIDDRIREACAKGRKSIHNPLVDLRVKGGSIFLPEEVKEALRIEYTCAGFDWVHHRDPDPGNPCSSAYTTLSW